MKESEMIGTENYKVKDCPFHVPKQNMKFFKAMQDAVAGNTLSSESADMFVKSHSKR